jgi:hypothetical protein
MSRLLLVGVFLEIGLVLVFVPWSTFWDRNYFVEMLPALQPIVSNPFVRGAVSGLGVLNLAASLVELAALVTSSRASRPEHAAPASRPTED